MPVIETRSLVKRYGRIEALKGVSLKVEKGQIYGLLGQNGAGKTTLIKVLLGLTSRTDGEAFLLDYPAGTTRIRQRVGYLPKITAFPTTTRPSASSTSTVACSACRGASGGGASPSTWSWSGSRAA